MSGVCDKVIVLCPLSTLSSLEESNDVQSMLQGWGVMLYLLERGPSTSIIRTSSI